LVVLSETKNDSVVNRRFVIICIYRAGNQFCAVDGSFVHENVTFRNHQNRPYAVPLSITDSLALSCFSLSRSSQAALIPSCLPCAAPISELGPRCQEACL